MNIYDMAMNMELEGEEYYKKQMDKAEHEGIKNVFKMMAEDERKHYEIIKNIKNNLIDCNKEIKDDEIETIFTSRLKKDRSYEVEVDEDSFEYGKINIDETVKAYRHARDIEKESIDFYKEQVEKSDNDCEKKIFERLVKEEKKHYEAIDNIIEHITKSERWLEDARFNNMEDY